MMGWNYQEVREIALVAYGVRLNVRLLPWPSIHELENCSAGSALQELGNKTQCLLNLVLWPVGKILHHGHIGKSSPEALAVRSVTLVVIFRSGRWEDTRQDLIQRVNDSCL